jgi:hypothetical protein
MKHTPVSWSDDQKSQSDIKITINGNKKNGISQRENDSSDLLPSHRPQVIGFKSLSQVTFSANNNSHEGQTDKKSDVIDHSVTSLAKIQDKGKSEEEVLRLKVSRGEKNTSNNGNQVKQDIQVSNTTRERCSTFKESSSPAIISLTSKSKDLSVYKRDYFVPSDQKPFEESLNQVEEKVI